MLVGKVEDGPSAASAARLKYFYDLMRENQVCELSRWDCGMVTGTF
jgi:hypothetical protein